MPVTGDQVARLHFTVLIRLFYKLHNCGNPSKRGNLKGKSRDNCSTKSSLSDGSVVNYFKLFLTDKIGSDLLIYRNASI
jgi:hypothetical protein